jgi:hypothetical protein
MVYQHIQQLFSSGLTTVVGSGLSSSYGLPGMGALADDLASMMPSRLQSAGIASESWISVAKNLKGMGLEAALDDLAGDDPVLPVLVDTTAEIILKREEEAIAKIMSSGEKYPLQELLAYIVRSSKCANVITTNYDRLIELACALASIPVDTGFSGQTIGYYDEEASRRQFKPVRSVTRGKVAMNTKSHVRLAKPHGSLDWYNHNGNPIRSEIGLLSQRLIITPGLSKYKTGYERPFDSQKNRATAAIDSSSALLFVGYGFNDDHLQTHLDPQFAKGTSTTILARTLTESARKYIEQFSGILAIEAWPNDNSSARIHMNGTTQKIDGVPLWDLGVLISEVLA